MLFLVASVGMYNKRLSLLHYFNLENEPSADYKTFFSKPLKMTVPGEFIKVTKMGATVTHETHSDE